MATSGLCKAAKAFKTYTDPSFLVLVSAAFGAPECALDFIDLLDFVLAAGLFIWSGRQSLSDKTHQGSCLDKDCDNIA